MTRTPSSVARKKLVVSALEDIKATDILAIDVRKLTGMFDWIVVASAESARQTKALARHVRDKLKAAGSPIVGVEGEESAEWVLVDTGDIVVHIMQPAVRAYYNLEELWGEGKFDRPANPTSPSGGRLAHASEEAEPSLPHGMPKPRTRSAAGSRKPRTAGPAPRTRKTTKAAADTAKPKPRRRKPAA